MTQPNPSLPQKPELVTLTPAENLFHSSALRRGQGEGLHEAGVALIRAAAYYQATDTPGDLSNMQKVVVCKILGQLSDQLTAQAGVAKREQNALLGQWLMVRNEPSEAPTPRRVGWVIRAWRASGLRLWLWAFAN